MTRIHKNVSFDATASVGEKWMCFFPTRTALPPDWLRENEALPRDPLFVPVSLTLTTYPGCHVPHKLWELVFVPKRGVFLVFYQYS